MHRRIPGYLALEPLLEYNGLDPGAQFPEATGARRSPSPQMKAHLSGKRRGSLSGSMSCPHKIERTWIMATVRDTVLEYVRTQIVPDRRITYETSLISLGFVNSLEMVAVKSYLEAHYRIRIPDEMATREAFDSVENITRLLARLGVR